MRKHEKVNKHMARCKCCVIIRCVCSLASRVEPLGSNLLLFGPSINTHSCQSDVGTMLHGDWRLAIGDWRELRGCLARRISV